MLSFYREKKEINFINFKSIVIRVYSYENIDDHKKCNQNIAQVNNRRSYKHRLAINVSKFIGYIVAI